MITVEELKCCLKEANFTEEAIDRICHKKIKVLLKTGRYQEIKDILEVLEKKEISKEAIENCLTVLAQGKAKEIKEIFEILEEKEISKEKIENCLSVLAKGKAKEIKEIFEILEEKEISKEKIENCLYVLALGKAKEIKEIFEILEKKKISKETIENCLSVLARGKAKEIKEIFEILEKKKISKETIENCLSVLARGKAKEIKEIFEILEEKEISKEAIENCLTVLALGKAKEIKEIFEILEKKEISKETIENCLSVLAQGKAKEIKEIFEILEKKEISKEKIENCLYVLAKGKAKEIKEIFEILEKKKISKEKIENCLYVLAKGKAKEIKEIFEILEKKKISKETIENCLTVLAQGKAKEIKEIFEILEEKEISKEKIENCLYVLAKGKAKEIKEIFEILEKNEISKKTIENNFNVKIFSKASKVKEIFEKHSEKTEKERIEDLKWYMKLKGFYNRMLTQAEILELCNYKQVSIESFIKGIVIEDDNFVELSKNQIEENGIYIGKSIPIPKEYAEENAESFIELSKKIAKKYCYKTRETDVADIESMALEIMITKCGDLVINLSNRPEIMQACIFNKVSKYLKSNKVVRDISIDDKYNYISKDISIDDTHKNSDTILPEEEKSEMTLDLNFTEEEKIVFDNLQNIVNKNEVTDYIEETAKQMNMETDYVINIIESIREKLIQTSIVRGENGHYEWNRKQVKYFIKGEIDMEYLLKYGFTKEQIQEIKELYNDNIIEFLSENEIFVTETIQYLYSEDMQKIYILMKHNIRIFLETKVALQKKIEKLKNKGYSKKAIQMLLIKG